MQFFSNVFLYFALPLIILVSFFFHSKIKILKCFIFIANIVFYLWAGEKAFFLLLIYAPLVFILAKWNQKYHHKTILLISIIVSIIPLLFVKYGGFFYKKSILFPLGISFYTFQSISLIADCFTGKINKKLSFIDSFLFLTFFITISSGPITRYNNFYEIFEKNIFSLKNLNDGIHRFIFGLGKKMILANNIMLLANYYFDAASQGESLSVLGFFLGSVAYSFQLYFDFSGYTDMAIGTALMMGLKLPENFNYPYCANSIQDFWKRWHMSLTKWFTDYIYIPLGGNRVSKTRHIFNLFAVWILTGIWHGSTLNFILWGTGYFLLQTAEKYINFFKRLVNIKIINRIYALFFINILWIVFRSENIRVLSVYFKRMIGIGTSAFFPDEYTIRFLPLIAICIICSLPISKILHSKNEITKAQKFVEKIYHFVKEIFMLGILFLSFCEIQSSGFSPFIYGKF